MLDYWLTHRWEVNLGIGYLDVFGFAGGSVNTTGPNIYFARCISPDGSWMGDFRDKYVVIEPAFPADLRVSNSGPALTGATTVNLAVTEVPNVSYAWTGPNAFTSTIRNPIINTPTEANAGIYRVTLNRGGTQPWACNTTATTKLTVSGCDIRIKASDPTTGVELSTLQKDPLNSGQYLPIALKVENGDGSPIQNMTYTWTAPSGITLLNPNNVFVLVQNSGNYSVRVAAIGNSNIGCRASIQIAKENSQEILWTKRYSTTFANGYNVPQF